ncbi:unnamed protein product [Somion occarium]|uniref:Uncharacterized protein n=1 Tax=Somion occarium TaxID=3059160 RepID=A0ABP1EBG7_9APHY
MHFPVINMCPTEENIGKSFYAMQDGTRLRHWCLLAEIIDGFKEDGILMLEVRDAAREKCFVAFRDKNDQYGGHQFVDPDITSESRKMKGRKTIAILYPILRYDLPGNRKGFIIDDISNFTPIPHSIVELYDANDRLREVATECCLSGCSQKENLKACSTRSGPSNKTLESAQT